MIGIFFAFAAAAVGHGALTLALERQQQADRSVGAAGVALAVAAERAWHQAGALEAAGGPRAASQTELRRTLSGVAVAVRELDRALAERPAERYVGSLGGAPGAVRHAASRLSAATVAGDVRAQAGALASAAQTLQAAVADAAQRRADLARAALVVLAAVAAALLALLAVAVIEPLVRSAGWQAARSERRALELQRLALVGENTASAVILCDAAQRMQWINPAFTRCTGWSAAEIEGALPVELLKHPLAGEDALAALCEAASEGRAHRTELRCRRRDGGELWLDLDLRALRDETGALRGFMIVAADIGAQVAERRKLGLLWSALPAGVMVVSQAGEIVDANRAAERMLGVARDGLLGRSLHAPANPLLCDEGHPYAEGEHPALRTLQGGRPLRDETMGVRLADGTLRWLLVNTEPQLDERGRAVAAVMCFSDITERRQLQEQLRASARADPLTGLPNRAVVIERLERALAHARAHRGYGFAVLFMDFDRFKQVNDTLGHGGGDELLRQIAARLRLVLRPGDEVARVDSGTDLAARLGGDEFVIVLDGVRDLDGVSAVAERLLHEVSEPYNVLDHPVQSGASIGIVLVADGAAEVDDAHALLRDADTAMYEAKRAGRGRWAMFDRSMHERLLGTMTVERGLRRALRDDELFVAYQPVVELASGRVSGVEALVRWQHPERGPSARSTSCRWPRSAAWSTRSAARCCARPAGSSCSGSARSERARRAS